MPGATYMKPALQVLGERLEMTSGPDICGAIGHTDPTSRVYIEECRLSNGLVIHSDSRTPVQELYKDVYRKCVYTPRGFPSIEPDDIVIDLGANIGMFTLYAASISPRIQVYAFEPASQSFALLERNVRANNLLNVHCYRCSVSAHTGKDTLYVANTGSTADTMITSRIPAQGALLEEHVDCLSLNDLFALYQIESCNFLKVDIEGSEFGIFSTVPFETLQKIKKIAMEYHEKGCGQGQQLAGFLRTAGFNVNIAPEPNSDRGMIYATR
jgi:FkbM family methyltransferase